MNIPAVQTPETVDDSRRFIRLGWIAAGAVFGGLLLWSIFAPINSAVIAPGQLSVESNRKTIQHLEGGVIRKILVREGQEVKAGDALIDITIKTCNGRLTCAEALGHREFVMTKLYQSA